MRLYLMCFASPSLRYNFNSFETALSTAEVSRQMVLFYSSVRTAEAESSENFILSRIKARVCELKRGYCIF